MKTIIVAALIIYSVAGLYFGISNKPFCFDIEEQPGKTIKFFYEVTGEAPQKTQVTIVASTNNAPIILSGASNKTEQSSDVPLNVCFLSTDGGAKSVSVDFYTHDKAHLL
jgi:ABC-type phosphate transport system substrate-binding protein